MIALRNDIPMPRVATDVFYDGGDRVSAQKAIIVSRASWEVNRGTGQATAVGVFSTMDHGTNFIAPVGTNVLANGMFTFADLMVMADQDETTVEIDPDGSGPIPPVYQDGSTAACKRMGRGPSCSRISARTPPFGPTRASRCT